MLLAKSLSSLSRWINLILLLVLIGVGSALRLLRPVVPTAAQQARLVRRQVAAAQLIAVELLPEADTTMPTTSEVE